MAYKKSTVEVGQNWIDIKEDDYELSMVYDKENDIAMIAQNGAEVMQIKGWHLRRIGWACREMKNE